jgi:hypothetical protein
MKGSQRRQDKIGRRLFLRFGMVTELIEAELEYPLLQGLYRLASLAGYITA